MYRPAIGMIVALASWVGVARASGADHTHPHPVSSGVANQTIIPDGNNLEQTEDWILGLLHKGDKQAVQRYVADITEASRDPKNCQATLDNLVSVSESTYGGTVKYGDKILAKLRPNSFALKVYDANFEALNPCKNASENHGQKDDPVGAAVKVFGLAHSGASHANKAASDYIESVASKAQNPEKCSRELQTFAEIGQEPTAEIMFISGKPVGITVKNNAIPVIDLNVFGAHSGCHILTP